MRDYFEKLTAKSEYLRTANDLSELENVLSESPPEIDVHFLAEAESMRLLHFNIELYKHICAVEKARLGNEEQLDAAKQAARLFALDKDKEFETAFESFYFNDFK